MRDVRVSKSLTPSAAASATDGGGASWRAEASLVLNDSAKTIFQLNPKDAQGARDDLCRGVRRHEAPAGSPRRHRGQCVASAQGLHAAAAGLGIDRHEGSGSVAAWAGDARVGKSNITLWLAAAQSHVMFGHSDQSSAPCPAASRTADRDALCATSRYSGALGLGGGVRSPRVTWCVVSRTPTGQRRSLRAPRAGHIPDREQTFLAGGEPVILPPPPSRAFPSTPRQVAVLARR
jgi:hypothetical protein